MVRGDGGGDGDGATTTVSSRMRCVQVSWQCRPYWPAVPPRQTLGP